MTPVSLLSLALAGPSDFEGLKARIDLCARAGHTCEFPGCTLLPGCMPPTGTVGFWGDKLGYMIFLHPAVAYSGTNTAAQALFRAGRQGFSTFEALAGHLRALAGLGPNAAPPPRPAPAAVTPRPQIPSPPPRSQAATAPPPRPAAPSAPNTSRPTLRQLADGLGQTVLGQQQAVETVAFRLYAHVAKRAPARPLSLIFYGPTGVGKSELGKQTAPVLNRFCGAEPFQFVWTELNTFTEPHSVYRLTGAPPGYVGYDDKPVLETVCHNPRTIFMFDELEKAHPEVLKTFMSILDEGRCAARKELPGHVRELDFRRCIFLFTTNSDLSGGGRVPLGFAPAPPAGEPVPPSGESDTLPDRLFAANERARRLMAAGGCLKEIAGRFGGFVEFLPLSDQAKTEIIAKQIAALAQEYGLTLSHVAPALVQTVSDRAKTGGAFSVRSHVGVIEGLFTAFFAEQGAACTGVPLRLEGTLEHKRLVPEGQSAWAGMLARARAGAG